MATIATLAVAVKGDVSPLNRDLGGAQSRIRRFGGRMSAVGKTITKGVTVPIVAAGAAAVKAAADQGEALNKTNVIFGQSGKQVARWSRTTAQSMGLSRAESLEAAGGFGAMLQTAGVARQQLAPMSTQLVKLSADMASFNNEDPSAMLERLRSGLSGEAEPLRRFGVFISAAAVNTQAYKDGIAKAGSELTEQQKVQARFNLIMEQTTKQQGDFERTAGSLPNQLSRLKASATDLAAGFGTILLPVVQQIASHVLALANRFKALSPETQKTIVQVLAVAAVVGPVIFILGKLVSAIAVVIKIMKVLRLALIFGFGPIGLIIVGVTLLAVVIIKNWDKIKRFTVRVWNAVVGFIKRNWQLILAVIMGPMGIILGLIIRNWDTIKRVTLRVWSAVRDFIGRAIDRIRDFIGRLVDRVRDFGTRIVKLWLSIPGRMVSIGVDIVRGIWEGIKSMAGWLAGQVKNFISSVVPGPIADKLGIGSPSKVLRDLMRAVPEGMALGILDGRSVVSRAANTVAGMAVPTDPAFGALGAAPRFRGRGLLVTLVFEGRSEDLWVKALRGSVRKRGGDVQAVLGGTSGG